MVHLMVIASHVSPFHSILSRIDWKVTSLYTTDEILLKLIVFMRK